MPEHDAPGYTPDGRGAVNVSEETKTHLRNAAAALDPLSFLDEIRPVRGGLISAFDGGTAPGMMANVPDLAADMMRSSRVSLCLYRARIS